MNDTNMNTNTMSDVTEAELANVDGGAVWVAVAAWFLTNLAYSIIDSMVGDPPGCNSVDSCYGAGRG